jgi:mono/diheme cytochrome c family protein
MRRRHEEAEPMRLRCITACLLLHFLLYGAQRAAAAGLTLGDAQPIEAEALLRRPDLAEVEVPQDPGYGAGPRRFRALPLAPLARGLGTTETAALVARAADGFVSHIPGALALRDAGDGARGWLAIEPPGQPWPPLPGKAASAGPFYILWQPTDRAVSSEYWAYQVTTLSEAVAPAERWPRLNVAASLAAEAPERRGQAVFIATCLPCDRLGGAGEAEVGPDLNAPMNPTRYYQRPALLRLIRDPASVRHWPEQRMPSFSPDTLPDADIEAVVRYLEHMAGR